jgi:hypothetical protein
MRKSIGLSVTVLVIAVVFSTGAAFAVNGAPSGPHFNINIIGHPKGGIGGDDSSGHSIMIPLRTVPGPDVLKCNVDGVNFVDDTYPTPGTLAPTGGAKIYFEGGENFEILDRDATDGEARIKLPVDMNSTTKDLKFAVYMRVLGKPNKYNPVTGEGTVACMNINAYVNDAADQTLWYQTGTVTVSRAKGKSSFARVTDLFMVWFCTEMVDTTCTTTANLSVFNDIFSGYFWNILNDGTRLVQVRFYPTN